MAELSGNGWYVAIDDVDVSAYATDISLNPSQDSEDVTTGAGVEHEMLNEALNKTKMKGTLSYRVGSVPDYIRKVKPGLHMLEYGPEGRVAGKPRHKQEFHFESCDGPAQTVKKTHVKFEISGNGSQAAEFNLYEGAVFP